MDLKTFKDIYIYKPEQVILIDRPLVLDGDEMHILALTYEDGSYKLWAVDYLGLGDAMYQTIHDPMNETNRDSLSRSNHSQLRSIESLEVDDYIFDFNGVSADNLNIHMNQAHFRLQYFMGLGINMTQFDSNPFSQLRLVSYKNRTPMERIDLDVKGKEITINFREHYDHKEVFHKYSLPFNIDETIEQTYINPYNMKEELFYVEKFEIYTFEDYIESIESNDKYRDVPRDRIDEMIKMMMDHFEDIESRNSSMVLMTYEADQSLQFLSTEYLDTKIDYSNNKQSSMIMMFKSDDEIGSHGKKLFIAPFQGISNDNLEIIDFEMHQMMKKFPGVTLKI